MAPTTTTRPETVKDLLDAATKAELARWFGLPSFEEPSSEAAPPPPEDPETAELRERRAAAAAAVDPALLDAMHQRYEVRPETLIQFEATIDIRDQARDGRASTT